MRLKQIKAHRRSAEPSEISDLPMKNKAPISAATLDAKRTAGSLHRDCCAIRVRRQTGHGYWATYRTSDGKLHAVQAPTTYGFETPKQAREAARREKRVGCSAPSRCCASGRTILSLFDYSGNWSRPYAEAGANVVQLDKKLGVDIMDLDCTWLSENVLEDYGTVDGILAAPPCTDFAVSGAQYWPAKDKSGQTAKSLELVRQVLRCVEYLKPDWWAMENPVGRLNTLLPELKKYGPWYFNPCDYGDPYTKKTGLWGRFVPPMPLWCGDNSVKPERVCSQGSWVQKLGGKSDRTKELRSMTPMGFAYAFATANCWPDARTHNDQAQAQPPTATPERKGDNQ